MPTLSISRAFPILALLALGLSFATAQQPAPAKPDTPAPIQRKDAALDAASEEIDRALFLRCFCAENILTFDSTGRPVGNVKTTDWTLAAVTVQKVERKSPIAIELDGVRVAIRFATDRREFDRHPLNDEKVRIVVPDTGDPRALSHLLDEVFSEGIDRRLQASMPEYWQHYFDPQMGWPKDELSGVTIYNPTASGSVPGVAKPMTLPAATRKANAAYTPEAAHDHIQGATELRVVIDAEGLARRTTVVQPLGYGLDAHAAEALTKWKFSPGTLDNKPVATYVLIKPEFVVVSTPN